MKILVTYPGTQLTGAARYAAALTAQLQSKGHTLAVAVCGHGPAHEAFMASSARASKRYPITFFNLRRNPRDAVMHLAGLGTATWKLVRAVRDFGPDLVIGHCVFNTWSALACAYTSTPFLAIVHELPSAYPRVLSAAWQQLLIRSARNIVAVSEAARTPFPHRQSSVIPPGVDTTAFHANVSGAALRKQWLGNRQGPLLVCLSHLMPAKGQGDVIEALGLLDNRLPNMCAVFVGGTNGIAANKRFAQSLVHRARELSIDQKVVFAPSGTDAATAIAAADVVIYPSHAESFGLVPLEAAAVGRPVVATRVGIAPHLARETPLVVLVDPHNPNQLAQGVLSALDRAGCSPFVRPEWTVEGAADAFEALAMRMWAA